MSRVGRRFAYRERAHTPGDPVRPVEVIQEGPPRSQKVKVRLLDGEYEGLEIWVPQVRLVAPWEQAEALLEDERRMFAALEVSGKAYDTVPYKATETVFFSLPQESGEEVFFGHKAIERERLVIDNLEAAAAKLELSAEELLAKPRAYVDRFGTYKAPFRVAVEVAQHYCRLHAGEVLRYIKEEEDELLGTLVSGDRASPEARWIAPERHREWAEARLRERKPVFALIRGWCGDAAVEEFDEVLSLRKEVDRLRELAEDTARWLRQAGHPVKAALLRKGLDRTSGSKST